MKSQNWGIVQTQKFEPNLSHLLFIPYKGGKSLITPFLSNSCHLTENTTLRTLAVRGCCGLSLSGDTQHMFLSFRGKYEAATALPIAHDDISNAL